MSQFIGTLFLIPGYLLTFLGGIWMLIMAFRNGIGWGLLILFFPPGALIFAFRHLRAFLPLIVTMVGLVFLIIGLQLTGQSGSG